MSTARVTKIICPSCEGNGVWMRCSVFEIPCQWCKGAKRISAAKAIGYARQHHALAVGGFLAGDHDAEDAERMQAKARRIFALLQVEPSYVTSR